jgi:hypothetical protein
LPERITPSHGGPGIDRTWIDPAYLADPRDQRFNHHDGAWNGVDAMPGPGVTPHGEGLRRAVRWLGEQPAHDTRTLEEACQRFDLTPLEADFLRREFGPWAHRPDRSNDQ